MNLIQNDVHKLKDLVGSFSKTTRISLKMGIGFFYIWSILGKHPADKVPRLNEIRIVRTLGHSLEYTDLSSGVFALQMAVSNVQEEGRSRRQEGLPGSRSHTDYLDDQNDRL
jgi:hypothetical protein